MPLTEVRSLEDEDVAAGGIAIGGRRVVLIVGRTDDHRAPVQRDPCSEPVTFEEKRGLHNLASASEVGHQHSSENRPK